MSKTIEYTSESSYRLQRGHEGDAGIDLIANENVTIPSGRSVAVHTGISFKIPDGMYGKIESRSGLATGQGIHHIAGVIDSGYRGEIIVGLENRGRGSYDVLKGDRIAQIIFQKYEALEPVCVETVSTKTERGEAGFGSTGY